jgi:hypothetical protein
MGILRTPQRSNPIAQIAQVMHLQKHMQQPGRGHSTIGGGSDMAPVLKNAGETGKNAFMF